ncbi:MAG: Na+/H+ antiporter subunit E [Bacillota bacterium]
MKNDLFNYLGVTAVLFLFWIALSGSFNWPQLVVGLAAASFVTFFNRSMLITVKDRPPVQFKTVLWLMGYFFKLTSDIFIANFQVAWLVLHPKMPIEPNMVELEVDIDKQASRVLLGNSITLTPGTLTVLSEGNKYLVHALTRHNGEALKTWPLIDRLKQMEVEK